MIDLKTTLRPTTRLKPFVNEDIEVTVGVSEYTLDGCILDDALAGEFDDFADFLANYTHEDVMILIQRGLIDKGVNVEYIYINEMSLFAYEVLSTLKFFNGEKVVYGIEALLDTLKYVVTDEEHPTHAELLETVQKVDKAYELLGHYGWFLVTRTK